MLRWNRRLASTLVVALMVLGLLAGCGGGQTGDQTGTPGSSGSDQVTITWWHIWQGEPEAKWQAIADAYMKEHPNVKIEINVFENEAFKQKIATAMQSGDPPDLFQSWGGGSLREYVKAGLVKDITDELQKDGWLDSLVNADLMSVDGRYYGIPVNVGMVGFWYNKDLFAKAGIQEEPKTWDEFLEVVKKLKAAGITPIALGAGEKWSAAFYWEYLALRLGGKDAFMKAYTRNGGSFADPPFVEAGKKLKELIDLLPFQDGFLSATVPDEYTLMATENAAIQLMGHWAPYSIRDSSADKQGLGDKLGWFPFPAVPGGAGDPNDALGGGDGIAVGKNAPPEAIDFLRFLSKKENLRDLVESGNILPATKGAEEYVQDPLLRELVQTKAKAQYLQVYYDQFLPPAAGQAVNDYVQQLFAGLKTPEEVAQGIEAAYAAEAR
ncbi:MAG: extracellular solute-binding protein [Firmicutes bacterium]|nr:extracellular solute-binding protein [Bacillota bacterium]